MRKTIENKLENDCKTSEDDKLILSKDNLTPLLTKPPPDKVTGNSWDPISIKTFVFYQQLRDLPFLALLALLRIMSNPKLKIRPSIKYVMYNKVNIVHKVNRVCNMCKISRLLDVIINTIAE